MVRKQVSAGIRLGLGLLLLTGFVSGCAEAPKGKGVPVEGTVTMDGKPLEGATVTFLNETFAGFGRTDANGKYRLVQGALPGVNKVVLSKLEPGAEAAIAIVDDPESGMDAGQLEAQAMGMGKTAESMRPKDQVPEDYSNPAKTKLTYDVPSEGASGVDFNI